MSQVDESGTQDRFLSRLAKAEELAPSASLAGRSGPDWRQDLRRDRGRTVPRHESGRVSGSFDLMV